MGKCYSSANSINSKFNGIFNHKKTSESKIYIKNESQCCLKNPETGSNHFQLNLKSDIDSEDEKVVSELGILLFESVK